jgi:hypothetical protein
MEYWSGGVVEFGQQGEPYGAVGGRISDWFVTDQAGARARLLNGPDQSRGRLGVYRKSVQQGPDESSPARSAGK